MIKKFIRWLTQYKDPFKHCRYARECSAVDGLLCPCEEMKSGDIDFAEQVWGGR